MRSRTWSIVILVNIVVSAAVVLTILFVWNRSRPAEQLATTLTPAPSPSGTPGAADTPSVRPEATVETLTYVVQSGDTLGAIAQAYGLTVEDLAAANGIADPNVLTVGQSLVIPSNGGAVPPPPSDQPPTESAVTVAPTPPSPATLTPSGPPLVEIKQVLGSANLAIERVIVRNRGGATSLDQWTLSSAEGNAFTFPNITIFSDAEVRVHSAAGESSPTDLYWGRSDPAWEGGELVTLYDAAGDVVDAYIVP